MALRLGRPDRPQEPRPRRRKVVPASSEETARPALRRGRGCGPLDAPVRLTRRGKRQKSGADPDEKTPREGAGRPASYNFKRAGPRRPVPCSLTVPSCEARRRRGIKRASRCAVERPSTNSIGCFPGRMQRKRHATRNPAQDSAAKRRRTLSQRSSSGRARASPCDPLRNIPPDPALPWRAGLSGVGMGPFMKVSGHG